MAGTLGQEAAAVSAKPMLETRDVVKRFGGVVALDGVSISVPERGFILLIGPNGSGKTTLVNVITGFLKPDHGRVFYKGRDITGLPPHQIAKMGIIRTFQIPKPFMNLTVLENLLVARFGHPGENPYSAPLSKRSWLRFERESVSKAFTILKWLGLEKSWDHKATELSGAELKLLEVGRALMSGAKMMIMDEPAAGVNPTQAHEIFATLTRLREEQGITFLVIEHRIDIAARYVDYIYAMHLGKVISQGPPDKVLRDPVVIESYIGG
ncbi:MAG: ABC transporter ATP-binding protein [Pyrodictiaceae archaeon]